jgi:hypothetical protein
MEPKLYLLFALFSTIVASSSHEDLREYLRKLRFGRPRKGAPPQQA